MADPDPLSLLRQFNVDSLQIIERDDQIIFGEFSWPKNVETTLVKTDKFSSIKTYYTLECLLYFLKNVNLTHPVYCRQAAIANMPAVRRPDRKSIKMYLFGESDSCASIDNKKVQLETTTKAPLDTTTKAPLETTSKAQLETTIKAQLETTTKAPLETTTKASLKTTSKAQLETTIKAPLETTSKAPLETTSKAQLETTTKAPLESTTKAPLEPMTELKRTHEEAGGESLANKPCIEEAPVKKAKRK